MELKFNVDQDAIIKEYLFKCGVSKRLGRKIKLYGKIYVNGVEKRNWESVKFGDELKVILPDKINNEIIKSKGKLNILYEDEYLIIVDKEADLAIHPSRAHLEDNLLARVLNYFEENDIKKNCHILTRLDYATSGIVIIAKDAYTQNLLKNTKITKIYYAVTSYKLPLDIGNICLPISRDETSNIKRKVSSTGKMAITEYKYLRETSNGYLYEIILHTGRTHQIRVHFSHFNAPIVGDKLYGGVSSNRLYLHCIKVEFIHPYLKKTLTIENVIHW